jgi:putative alpha-1,2-mannosidase
MKFDPVTVAVGFLSSILFLTCPLKLFGKDPADYVNPFIGAGSMEGTHKDSIHGKNFPGADTPEGMVQLSPDTISGGDNGGGYSNVHTTVEGFSFNHMSGVGWFGDLGNFLVMPTTGPLKTYCCQTDKPGSGYLSAMDKSSEVDQAGYYAVKLKDFVGIGVICREG